MGVSKPSATGTGSSSSSPPAPVRARLLAPDAISVLITLWIRVEGWVGYQVSRIKFFTRFFTADTYVDDVRAESSSWRGIRISDLLADLRPIVRHSAERDESELCARGAI